MVVSCTGMVSSYSASGERIRRWAEGWCGCHRGSDSGTRDTWRSWHPARMTASDVLYVTLPQRLIGGAVQLHAETAVQRLLVQHVHALMAGRTTFSAISTALRTPLPS